LAYWCRGLFGDLAAASLLAVSGSSVGLPIIRQIAAMVYNRFADYRFARLAHCQIAQKTLAKVSTS